MNLDDARSGLGYYSGACLGEHGWSGYSPLLPDDLRAIPSRGQTRDCLGSRRPKAAGCGEMPSGRPYCPPVLPHRSLLIGFRLQEPSDTERETMTANKHLNKALLS